jgi:hypothetical protein
MLDPDEMLSFDADTASADHGDDDVIAVFAVFASFCFLFLSKLCCHGKYNS